MGADLLPAEDAAGTNPAAHVTGAVNVLRDGDERTAPLTWRLTDPDPQRT
ncbi:hypothetical protein ACFUEM_11435 [Streptomyces anulatus]